MTIRTVGLVGTGVLDSGGAALLDIGGALVVADHPALGEGGAKGEKGERGVGLDRDIGDPVAADLGRLDIDLDELRALREEGEDAGLELLHPRADSDEQVAATVTSWEQAQGIGPEDWQALGAEERDETEVEESER